MIKMKNIHFTLALITLSVLSISRLSRGDLLFDGDAALGAKAVWKNENKDGSGTEIDAVDDPTLNITVWQFTKPEGAHRCEGHGAKGFQAKEGDDLYIGWNLNLNLDPSDLTTNANFQWKAYPADQQNYPVILKTIDGQLVLEQYNPGKKRSTLWTFDFSMNTWYSIVLRIKVSKNIKKGFVEFWFQGEQVTFNNNGRTRFVCRTFDGNAVDPKWGVYGGDDGTVVNKVGNIRIATTLQEASPPN